MKQAMFSLFVLVAITSCRTHPGSPGEDDGRIDSMLAVSTERVSTSFVLPSFAGLRSTLDSLNVAKKRISTSPRKPIDDAFVNEVNLEVDRLNRLHAKSESQIRELNEKLASAARSGSLNRQLLDRFRDSVALLNGLLKEKDAEVRRLNSELSSLNRELRRIATTNVFLSIETALQEQYIASNVQAAYIAYYTIGSRKDLEQRKVISSTGVWPVKKTTTGDAIDPSQFNTVDYRTLTSIPVNSRHAKIVTTHPSESFRMQRSDNIVKSIEIVDPDLFWSVSRFLVIMTD